MIHVGSVAGLLVGLLALTSMTLALAGPAPIRVFIPQWKQGQTWTVECDVPDLLSAKVPPWIDGRKPGTARRPRWVFTVVKRADATPKLRLIQVNVRSEDPKARMTADLVFAGHIEPGGALSTLFLYKADYSYAVRDTANTIRREYNRMAKAPFPVFNDVNDIPCDFPYLDLTLSPATDTKADGIWREYKARDVVEGDLRDLSVRQTILFNPSRMQYGEQTKVPIDRSLNQDVYLRKLGSGQRDTLRLVFNPSYPWPVYGEGPRGKFWLVK